MPLGLNRYHQSRQTHFITFTCYQRMNLLASDTLCLQAIRSLETTRKKFNLRVYAFVLMPNHVHLLISEPKESTLAAAIQSFKISSSKSSSKLRTQHGETCPLWQKRYYDRNVTDHDEFVEKMRYIHRNPVKRHLCAKPEDWPWSSFRHYRFAEVGFVEIESEWTAARRNGCEPRLLQLPPE
jgi:putative transposase